jgi:hypothetical protein
MKSLLTFSTKGSNFIQRGSKVMHFPKASKKAHVEQAKKFIIYELIYN